MSAEAPESPEPEKLQIYFWPNLLTAGNLFCGFLALTKIVEASPGSENFVRSIHGALFLILLATLFDLFDGRVARMAGKESPFGQEFDSLADIISFGAAPAFLVYRIVLGDMWPAHPQVGWVIASIYLICGAFRLARFNCMARQERSSTNEFQGFPIPAAAGLVASLTLLLLWVEEQGFAESRWRYLLPVLLVFLSAMMVSEVKYPSFKSLDFRAKRSFPKMLMIVLAITVFVILWESILPIVAPIIFSTYLIYGFVRPWLPKRTRQGIEEEDVEEDESEHRKSL